MTELSVPAETDPTASLVRSVRRIAQAIDVRSREISRLTGLTLPQLLVLQSIRAMGEVSTSSCGRVRPVRREISRERTSIAWAIRRTDRTSAAAGSAVGSGKAWVMGLNSFVD